MAIRGSHLDLQRAYEPSRFFNAGLTEYLQIETAAVTVVPLTMACWFYSIIAVLGQTLIGVYDASQPDEWFRIIAAGGVAGDPIRAQAKSSLGGTENADTTTGYAANVWHHACGVFVSNANRKAYINGGSVGSNAIAVTPANIDRTAIGRAGDSTPTDYMWGRIAWPTIWNVALTPAEVGALGNRQKFTPPWEVRPESIVSMPNMRTLYDPYMRTRWTPTGTVCSNPPWLWRPPVRAYAPQGPRIPIAMRHYKQLMGAN